MYSNDMTSNSNVVMAPASDADSYSEILKDPKTAEVAEARVESGNATDLGTTERAKATEETVKKFQLARPEIMDQPMTALIEQFAAHVGATRPAKGKKDGARLVTTRVRNDLASVFGTLSYFEAAQYSSALAEMTKREADGKLGPKEAPRVMNTAKDFLNWIASRVVFGF